MNEFHSGWVSRFSWARAGNEADAAQHGISLTSIPNTDVDGFAPDPSGLIQVHEHEAARSALWRTGCHEAGHIATSRFQNLEVAGSSILAGDGYLGLTWSTGSKRALRGKAAYDADGSAAQDAVAVRVAHNISQFMPGAGESRDDVNDIFSSVQAHTIALMGGGAAEMVFLGDAPPQYIESDVLSANAIAGIICRSPASRAAFIEYAYQASLEIIESNKPVVLALARALLTHPKFTLNGSEIDAVIATAMAAQAAAAESKRRTDWRFVENSAAEFAAELESPRWACCV